MNFDLERAKKEGCILVQGREQYEARIICDDMAHTDPELKVVVLSKGFVSGCESVSYFRRDGKFKDEVYLKNKPQKLEVRIYKNAEGRLCATEAYLGELNLIKTIEVEI